MTLITRRRAWLAGWVWVLTKSALLGRAPFFARIARPRLGCAGPVVPGGPDVLVVRCPARRVRDYPGGSGPPGGSGTPWGPRSTPQAISTRLSAGPRGGRGTRGWRGEQEPGGRGFRGRGRGGRLAGRGRAEATRPLRGSWRSLVPGGPDLPRLPGRRPGPVSPGPVRRKPRMAAPAGRARGDGSHRSSGHPVGCGNGCLRHGGGCSTLKWPHCSPLIGPHREQLRGGSSLLIWPRLGWCG